jgi:hypothetical protein
LTPFDPEARGEFGALAALGCMSDRVGSNQLSDPLDQLVDKLLASGGVFSQIIHHMLECERSQPSADELAPVLEVAHSLVRSVVGEVGRRYSRRDILIASRVVDEVTEAVCEEIFLYSPDDEAQVPWNGDRYLDG